MTEAFEVNFDGLVGNTHNYAGLSYGNVASATHGGKVSHPRAAALQGLEKMWTLCKLGVKQGVLPPHERPHIETLRALGYRGKAREILEDLAKSKPGLLMLVSSASCMWTANAATICPSRDSADRRLHITPANLSHKFHRSIEADVTTRCLAKIFDDPSKFVVHPALPCGEQLGDEGAANHTRFCTAYGGPGLHLFVYGREGLSDTGQGPKVFPARQSLEASHAVARLHQLAEDQCLFIQQNPDVIDAGVFHNDVISVGNGNVFLYHEDAFLNQKASLQALREKYEACCGEALIEIPIHREQVSVEEAVGSYLFNSQILTLPDGTMTLIAPTDCEESRSVKAAIDHFITATDNPIQSVHYMDVRESMQNGGGPACLRQRIVMTASELKACHQGVLLNEPLYKRLKHWIGTYYRENLSPADILDPELLEESRAALQDLTQILQLGPIYDFQRIGSV